MGGYEHVVVLRNIKVVDGDIVEAFKQLPRGTVAGDCIHSFLDFFASLYRREHVRLFLIQLYYCHPPSPLPYCNLLVP